MVESHYFLLWGGFLYIRGSNKWLLALGLAQAGASFGFCFIVFYRQQPPSYHKEIADNLYFSVVAFVDVVDTHIIHVYDPHYRGTRYASDQTAGHHERIPDEE